MNIRDFIKQNTNNKKLLVVKDISRATKLIKSIERENGDMSQNVVCKTMGQLAEDIVSYVNIFHNAKNNMIVISNLESSIIVKNLIRENITHLKYFTNMDLINLSMAKEIFSNIDYIRRNGWKNSSSISEPRIIDVKLIIDLYEEYLAKNELRDTTVLLREALAYLQSCPEEKRKAHITQLCGGEVFGFYDDSEDNTLLEDQFTEMLMSICNPSEKVVYNDDAPSIEKLDNLKGKTELFRGYGSSNEANYVVNDIASNKIAFGDAMVVYTDGSQLPFIQAAFRGNDIPTRFLSEASLNNNPYVALIRDIIGWAQDDYSEEYLEKILSNKSLYVDGYFKDSKGKYTSYNYIGGQKYFNHIIKAKNRRDNSFILGWGYDRNLEFLDREDKYIKQYYDQLSDEDRTEDILRDIDSRKGVLKLHRDLLDVFKEINTCQPTGKIAAISVYDKLLEFIQEHTKEKDLDYMPVKAGLYKVRHILESETPDTPEAALSIIGELVSQLGIGEVEDTACVSVKKLDSWTVLDRPYVYFLGLSLKNYQDGVTESPVMRDGDWNHYISGNTETLPTIDFRSEKKTRDLYRTLSTFRGKRIHLGYSYYDVASLCESSPSSVFRELLGRFSDKTIDEIPEFIYGNPSEGVKYNDSKAISVRAEADIDFTTSNSSLERFVDCPLRYAYEKRVNISPNEFQSRDNTWLNATQRGSFFHSVAERYVKERMICSTAEDVNDMVDNKRIESIVEDIKAQYIVDIPYTSKGDVDMECQDILQAATRYFDQLHKKRHSSGAEFDWRIADAEYKFNSLKFPVTLLDGEVKEFEFSGIIDRVDYRISDYKIFIRVSDYKTGLCEKKDKANKTGALTQHMIYKAAIMNPDIQQDLLNKIAGLEGEKVKNCVICFESFIYEFPMDDSNKNSIVIKDSEIDGLNLIRLEACLQSIKDENRYMDKVDLYQKLDTYKSSYPSHSSQLELLIKGVSKKDTTELSEDYLSSCKYCDYRELCYKKRVGEI